MKNVAVLSPQPIFKKGVRGSLYDHGHLISGGNRITVLPDFPQGYALAEDCLEDVLKREVQVKDLWQIHTLVIHVAHPWLDLIEPLASIQGVFKNWLVAEPAEEAVSRLAATGVAGAALWTLDRRFAPTALGLIVANLEEYGKVMRPDGVKQIYPRPLAPPASPPMFISAR